MMKRHIRITLIASRVLRIAINTKSKVWIIELGKKAPGPSYI